MLALGLFILVAFVNSAFGVGEKCMDNGGCAADECCDRQTGPLIVSKRDDLPLLSQSIDSVEGVCKKFKSEGDYCSFFETANGHCGCGAGLSCQFVAAKPLPSLDPVQIQPVSKRSVFFPGPGTVQCTRQKTTNN